MGHLHSVLDEQASAQNVYLSTEDAVDWIKYYQESKRQGFANANDAGKALIGASTTLDGGYIALLGVLKIGDHIPARWGFGDLLWPDFFFWLAMITATFTIVPQWGEVESDSATSIEALHLRTMKIKLVLLAASIILMIGGLASTLATLTALPAQPSMPPLTAPAYPSALMTPTP